MEAKPLTLNRDETMILDMSPCHPPHDELDCALGYAKSPCDSANTCSVLMLGTDCGNLGSGEFRIGSILPSAEIPWLGVPSVPVSPRNTLRMGLGAVAAFNDAIL